MSISDKVNILMVDDQPGKLLSYQSILENLGENLIPVASAKQALEVLLEQEIAIILMDVSMPELDGFELADLIRRHPRFEKTAILFISAVHMTDMDRVKGYQRGAMDYISVPVIPELLRAKVSVFADLYRKTRELESLNRELEMRVLRRTEELRGSEEQVRRLNGQMEQRIHELETIMKVLPVGVSVAHDAQCRSITGNPAMQRLFETGQDELAVFRGSFPGGSVPGGSIPGSGDEPYAFYRGDSRVPLEELPLQRAAATGKAVGGVELELRLSNGKRAQTLLSANPLFDPEGNVRGAVGAFIDITERKQMEHTLRERAELLELANEAIITRALDGTIQFWNSGAAALFGWTVEEAVGQNLHELLETKFPVPQAEINRTLAQGARWEGNLLQKTRQGDEIVVSCRKVLRQDRGKPPVVLEICRDITGQLQAEEALRRSERLAAMGRMAGIVAHEINNPLEAIMNIFYLLQQQPALDEQTHKYAVMAEQELQRVAHITKQTLGFYRESARPIDVALSSVIDDILALQAREIAKAGISVERRFSTQGLVLGFPGELKQVFLNLIGNAIQAMSAGGRLYIRLWDVPHSERVRVSITDTGLGIEPADAVRLFEPFFSTKSTKGTGLGLWISSQIIQKHEGSIRFRSVRTPRGNLTCFAVSLPASASRQSAQSPEPLREATARDGVSAGGPEFFATVGGQ